MKAQYIEVNANVRYWEDASVNGHDDPDGTLIPCRSGNMWKPIIDIGEGCIINWPIGTTAYVHYKVCDEGEYWLLDSEGKRIAKYKDDYVPNSFLCHGDEGYGDYIIMDINSYGKIRKYTKPSIVEDHWKPV